MDISAVQVNSPHIFITGRSTDRHGNMIIVEFSAVNHGKLVQDYESNEMVPDTFTIAVGMGDTEEIAYNRAVRRIEEDHGQHIAEEVRRIWPSFTK